MSTQQQPASNNSTPNNAAALAAAIGSSPSQTFTPDCYLGAGESVKPVVNIIGARMGVSPQTIHLIVSDPAAAIAAAMAAIQMAKQPATLQRLQVRKAERDAKKTGRAAPAVAYADPNSPAALLAAEMAKLGQ